MSITYEDVITAHARIADYVRRTPLAPSSWLSEISGSNIQLKLESLQITNSFKLRGAVNAISALVERSANAVPHVVTASAGNHGRAMAWAAEQLETRLTVFTSKNAPRTKRDAIRYHGADLRDSAIDYDEAERQAKAFALETPATFISAYNDHDVIAGAGTIGLEILEESPNTDLLVVPVGGGGLLSGIAIAVKTAAPQTSIIGVEVNASQAFQKSLAAGRITRIEVGDTIADGLTGNLDPQSITFDIVKELVDDMIVVDETAVRNAIRGLAANEKLIVEGAGAAAVAAVLNGAIKASGRNIVPVVSGANIDFERLIEVLPST